MNVNRPKPGAPAHLQNQQALLEKVAAKYGAFGAGPDDEDRDRKVLLDNFFKPTVKIIAGVFVATLFASFISRPAFSGPGTWANSFRIDTALAVVWAPLLFWVMSRQRVWKALRIYLVLALFIEAFSEAMLQEQGVVAAGEGGYWNTVMWPAAVAFFGTLKEFSGLPGASLSVFFFTTVGLLYRAVMGKKSDTWVAPPKFARQALLTFLGTVVVLAAVGVARGGGIEPAFRQTIHLIQLPLVGLLFLYALRVPEDLASVGTAFVCAAVARSFLVMYVYFGVCVPAGITRMPGKPEWCTNHSDTVLFVTALMILLSHALEQRTTKITLRALALAAPILLGIVLNNRRLAFVSLAAAPMVLYLAMKPSKRKRRLTWALAISVPVVAAYVLIGSEIPGDSPLTKPAKLVVSVLDQKDNSSISRDIENENLIYTLRQAPGGVLATGFGHEYQYSPNNPPVDLGDLFKNFRLIAHNGVLWIWSLAGVVGFTLLWMVYPLAATLALRGYRAAETPLERSGALAALSAVVVVVVQIWGDQGFNSYMTLVTFGVAFAVATRLAMRRA
ncbi:MAG: O-antigen ligase family protein [Deltaproteobacteria bacterium]|nr:O-antigen ligase family protein [Deltaproteobacteria bacterium]